MSVAKSKTPVSEETREAGRLARFLICGLAGIVLLVLFIKFAVPFIGYNIAVGLIKAEKYEAAVSMLDSLGDYRDSRKLLTEVVFANRQYMHEDQIVEFGQWDGEPVEWFVYRIDDERVMLLAYQVLIGHMEDFDHDGDIGGQVRNWLNGEFYDTAFTDEQKQMLLGDEDWFFLLGNGAISADDYTHYAYSYDRNGVRMTTFATGDQARKKSVLLYVYGTPESIPYEGIGVRPCVWIEV